jgi:HK97 family phage major capsid protein
MANHGAFACITPARLTLRMITFGSSARSIAIEPPHVRGAAIKTMERERLRDFTQRLRVAEQFSVERVLRACAAGDKLDGLEAEACTEAAHAARQTHDNARPIIPWAALRPRATRDLSVASDSALVGTDVVALDILRPFSIVVRAGVTVLPNLTADVALTRTSATSTVSWMSGESASATPSTPTFGSTAMTPKTGIGVIQVSRRFTQQVSDPEGLMRRELGRTAASVIDTAALKGAGSGGEPDGVLNVSNVGAQTGTSLAWADVLSMKQLAAAANAQDETIAFIGATGVRELLEGRTKESGGGRYIWEGDEIASCPAFASTLMPDATLLSGPFSMVYLGLWGPGIVVDSNPYNAAAFKAGVVQWRVSLACDVAIGCDPAAFTAATSIT